MKNINEILNTILTGHVLDVLKEIPDESIDLGITSPPYWGLRNYKTPPQVWGGRPDCNHAWEYSVKKGITGGTKSKKVRIKGTENFQITKDTEYATCGCGAWLGELGQEPTIKMYVEHLFLIFEEFKRVLKPTGSLWVNLGDTYAANRPYQVTGTKQVEGSQPYSQPQARDSGILPKSLCAIPDRLKIMMIDGGWINRNEIIWKKDNQMPSSAKDRFTVDFEKFYWFTKNGRYYFSQQLEHSVWAEKDKRSETGRTIGNGKASQGIHAVKGSGTYRKDKKRNKRTVWSINTKPYKGAHFATFPPELIRTPIIACCPEGGVVLDMFFGAGTTGLVATQESRNYIGIELGKDSVEMAIERLQTLSPT